MPTTPLHHDIPTGTAWREGHLTECETTAYIGPIDLDMHERGTDVYRAGGDLIACLRPIGPHAWAVTELDGTELGRVRWDGQQWDASAHLPAEGGYRLLGGHHSVKAAISAVLRS